MLLSMTGYGQAFVETEKYSINVEIKSINHRFSEITLRMPRQFLFLEERLKKLVSHYIQRGKVDLFLTVTGEDLVQRSLQVDWDLLENFYDYHQEAEKRLAISQPFVLDKLLIHPDVVMVIEKENQSEGLAVEILAATNQAAVELLAMRQREGTSLLLDLQQRLEKLHALRLDISAQAPTIINAYYKRLLKRVEEYLQGKLDIDEARLVTEVAIFADKVNIDEELTRLNSHIEQFYTIIENKEKIPIGRKLDFLVQEMHREVNTIGSKSNHLHINKQVVELKAELEKIKEQVQNIE